MVKLLKKRRAKKQAEELAKKTALQDLRSKNRAKREADLKARREVAAAKKAKGPGMSGLASAEESAKKSAEMKKFKESEKQKQAATKRGLSNIRARREAAVGETYQRTEADNTTRKMVKRDQPKPIEQKTQTKPAVQKPSSDKSEFSKTFAEERKKQGAGGEFAFKGKKYTTNLKEEEEGKMAKHGGALAIMIAPVKSKKMKAVKKAKMGASLKEVPSDNKGLGKLPKKVRNKMGYMKNGGKVKRDKIKMSREEFRLKQREAAMRNELKENSKNPDSKKRSDAKTQNQLDRAMRANQIKKTKDKAGKGGYDKMMYGGKVTDPKKKRQSKKEAIKNIKAFGKGKGRGTGLIFSDSKSAKDAYKDAGKNVDMVKNTAKNPMPKKGLSLIEKARKKSGTKMMYGGAMKKAMYGAKMKKKAMYGAKMKK